MNQLFNSAGCRYYSANEPSLAVRAVSNDAGNAIARKHAVYGIQCLTDSVLDAASTFTSGYDGDTAIFGPTLLAGHTYFFRLSRVVFVSGTGFLLLEQ